MPNELDSSLNAKNKQFVTFYIEDYYIGIDILKVKEINSEFNITPVFHAPEGIKGYVNIRGNIFLIVDLKPALHLKSNEMKGSGKLIIFKDLVAKQFGIIVDKVGDIVSVSDEEIEVYNEKPEFNEYMKDIYQKNLVEGICKLNNKLLIVLNAHAILETIVVSI